MELQMIDAQIKQFEQQLMQIEEQNMGVSMVIESLAELTEVKTGCEILVPVANGIFAKAQIKDTKTLSVNVGGGAVVEKTVEETKQMLKKQAKDIEKYKEEAILHLQQMIAQAAAIQKELKSE